MSKPVLFAELAFRGWFPVWLAVLLGVLAAVAVVSAYRREVGRIGGVPRAVMAGLRAVTLFGILFLLLRPSWLSEFTEDRPRSVALLVDDSQSMTTRDPRANYAEKWRVAVAWNLVPMDKPLPANPSAGDIPEGTPEKPSRIEVVKKLLTHPTLELLPKLAAVGPLSPATVGLRRSAKDARDAKWVDALAGTEPRSALAEAGFDLLRRDENDLPAAVVLVTDGRDNASPQSFEDLARECARLNVPVHVIGVGSSAFGQLQLRDAAVNETLFVDDIVTVPVRYRLGGFKDGTVDIVLKLGGLEVSRKTVELKEGDDLRTSLSFVPQQKDATAGKQEFTVTIRATSGAESVTDEMVKAVRIVDRKVKVLVVDSVPRWDFKFLQRALLRDRRVKASFFLTDGDPRAMKSGPPFVANFPATRPELFEYDLLILGDIHAGQLTPEQQVAVRDFVAEGGGLIHLAGRNLGPASWVGTPMADTLPVELQSQTFPLDAGTRPESYRPQLTPSGQRSTVFSLADDPVDNQRQWQSLPELYWHYPVTKLKPAADVFVVHPRAVLESGKPMPLVAAHYYGKGYCVFVGFDETWRWRFNAADTFFTRFWSQTVYAAGVPRTLGTKLTQLALDTPDPTLGKTGQVYARLLNPDLRPLTAERLEARLEWLDAAPDTVDRSTSVDLKALPGVPGEYVATLPFNRVGRFALKVDNGSEPAALEYRVALPPDHELATGGLNEEPLRKLAEATGGRFFREDDVHQLPAVVKPKTVPVTRREELLLWNRWALFLVIASLTLEWVMRKFHGLS